ncbi:TPA: hypothetical protein N0F65_008539 [Lagenidium giganteum]|uniref:Cation/H+ exchanger transmembrane domain-containing protein n=1 Tax=Lagenidium giganteum TaxID=4803 RepID=A0AAV2YP14_9STRA|nr:TPA: hypothetical protein N0F65_008539 [Lagenidium giganteum]
MPLPLLLLAVVLLCVQADLTGFDPEAVTDPVDATEPTAHAALVVNTSLPMAALNGTNSSAVLNVSIDNVEAHLTILQQLEVSVAKSIDKMNAEAERGGYGNRRSAEALKLRRELEAVKSNLKQLAVGLNGTLHDLEVVEKDTEQKSKKLEEVLQQQAVEQQEEFMEKHGMKVVDYETGHIKNDTVSGLSSLQREKLEDVEKKVDPAVLHYDFELLGQIAILLGVSAIGGIVASYLSIPPHVGYLLGGALVGPSCLSLVRQYKEVETISLFGSIFLLFGHGAGYSIRKPEEFLKLYLVGGLAYVGITVTMVALVSVYIGWTSSFLQGMTVGIAVSFTTTAPLYEHIRTNQIEDTSFGRTVIAIIAFQDILMSFALGTPEWFSVRSVGWIGVAALRSVVAYGVVVCIAMGLHQYVVPKLLHFLVEMEKVHHSPLVLLGVVSVCLFMALFSEYVGLSLECGAFLAGLAFMNASIHAKAAITSIRVMENLFGSMFFACVGMILNPIFLIKNAGEIISMVILIVAIKTLSATAVMTFFNVSIHKALVAAIGLCQIGELALIFMIKAHHSKLVSRRIYLLFVAAIAIFLGCSSIVNRQVVLARRKNIYRLPSVNRGGRARATSSMDDSHIGMSTPDRPDDDFSPPHTPRRKLTHGN